MHEQLREYIMTNMDVHTTRNHEQSSYYSRQSQSLPWLQQASLIKHQSRCRFTCHSISVGRVHWLGQISHQLTSLSWKTSPPRFCPSHRYYHLALTNSPYIYSYTRSSSSSSTEEVWLCHHRRMSTTRFSSASSTTTWRCIHDDHWQWELVSCVSKQIYVSDKLFWCHVRPLRGT